MMKNAILFDGGFLKPKYHRAYNNRIDSQTVCELASKLQNKHASTHELLRIYYYDSPPLSDTIGYPVSQNDYKLRQTPVYAHQTTLLQELKQSDYVAVREGILVFRGWVLKNDFLKTLSNPASQNLLTDNDFKPNIQQKGVDTKFGLDVAWMSFCKIVDRIILVTGDSDFVPAIKAARRNGIQVVLCTLNHGVSLNLRNNADILDTNTLRDIMNNY